MRESEERRAWGRCSMWSLMKMQALREETELGCPILGKSFGKEMRNG